MELKAPFIIPRESCPLQVFTTIGLMDYGSSLHCFSLEFALIQDDVPLELNFIVEELPHVSINSPDTINLLK